MRKTGTLLTIQSAQLKIYIEYLESQSGKLDKGGANNRAIFD